MLSKQQIKHNKKQFESELNVDNKDKKPYVSFVTVARNDDHGGDFLPRMIVFITALLEQVKKHNLRAELIIVDWNPPPDKFKLHQAIIFSSPILTDLIKNSSCKIRIIEVPPEIHKRFQHSDKIQLFQMIGKNVGIKRAHGKFVIATNIDLLFSDKLIKTLASKSLKPKFFYRIDRYDVNGIPYEASISQQFDHCIRNVIRVNRKDGTFTTISRSMIWLEKRKRSFSYFHKFIMSNIYESVHDAKALVHDAKALLHDAKALVHDAKALVHDAKALVHDAKALVHDGINLIRFRQKNKKRGLKEAKITTKLAAKATVVLVRGLASLAAKATVVLARRLASLASKIIISPISRIQLFNSNRKLGYPLLHTNACGDFTLMATEKWHALRGYPELEIFSWNLDSIILQTAYEYGLREKVFKDPMRMYHMEHSSGWTPEQQDNLFKRLKDKDIPYLSFEEFKLLAKQMHREKRPIIFNKEDWGLGSEILLETSIN